MPTIQKAEVLSFRLTVPLGALEELTHDAHGLELDFDATDDHIEVRSAGSLLAFRPDGDSAVLERLELCEDRGGRFFHRVISDLMARFGGDLHVKLTWSGSARADALGLAEIRIERGQASYPALRMKNVVSALRNAAQPLFDPAPASDDEVEKILERARAEFAEYQRLRKGQ